MVNNYHQQTEERRMYWEQAAVPQTAGQRFVFSWKERGRFHEKELIWTILNTEHTQEDSPVRERVPTERVCVGCLKSQGWSQESAHQQLPEDKLYVHWGDCHLRSHWDTLQRSHKSTSREPASRGIQQVTTAALAPQTSAISSNPLCLGPTLRV